MTRPFPGEKEVGGIPEGAKVLPNERKNEDKGPNEASVSQKQVKKSTMQLTLEQHC